MNAANYYVNLGAVLSLVGLSDENSALANILIAVLQRTQLNDSRTPGPQKLQDNKGGGFKLLSLW